jgi:hypothetical protein
MRLGEARDCPVEFSDVPYRSKQTLICTGDKDMRIFIWSIVIVMCATLGALEARAQVSSLDLRTGKRAIVKGKIRQRAERLYTFEAQEGQKLVVRLISTDRTSSFSVNLQDRIEYETVVRNLRSWSGELPRSESGIYSIAVKTRKPVATFTLDISIR